MPDDKRLKHLLAAFWLWGFVFGILAKWLTDQHWLLIDWFN